MTDAPERIWVDEHGGNWSPVDGGTQRHKYLRADLVPALLAADRAAVIEAATQALAKGTEAFAAERMNRGIRDALAGKNVQSLT